jgi:hypothetical protein
MTSLLDRAEVCLHFRVADQLLGGFPLDAGSSEVSRELVAEQPMISGDVSIVVHDVSPCREKLSDRGLYVHKK